MVTIVDQRPLAHLTTNALFLNLNNLKKTTVHSVNIFSINHILRSYFLMKFGIYKTIFEKS